MARAYDYRPEIAIAADLRKYVPRQRSLLFHGSVTPCAILRSDCIRCSGDLNEDGICFSRLLHVGVYWARLGRRPDENQGAIFVLDRDKLASDFRLLPYRWNDWWEPDKSRGDFEAEERAFGGHVRPLLKYLVDVLWLPECCHRPFGRRVIAHACSGEKVPGSHLYTKPAAKAA